jgi:hypothetical protein
MNDRTAKLRTLAIVLRIMGAIDSLAVLAIFLPQEWMATAHAWLGMGKLPEQPIIGYLTRSASALYALHGAMILFVSTDVERYTPLIKFLAVAALIHGIVLFLIDVEVGMPGFWRLIEGPGIAAMGTIVLTMLPPEQEERNT